MTSCCTKGSTYKTLELRRLAEERNIREEVMRCENSTDATKSGREKRTKQAALGFFPSIPLREMPSLQEEVKRKHHDAYHC